MLYNILIMSISSKIPLIKKVIDARNKFNKDALIFGADINKNVLGRFFVDKFWLMKKVNEILCDEIVSYCLKNKIKFIIPTRDDDTYFLSKYKEVFEQNNIKTFTPSYDTVLSCYDKFIFYEKNKQYNTIPTHMVLEDISSQYFVVKDRFGSGSKEILITANKEEAKRFSKKIHNPIFQPYIEGIEFSVDSYLTKDFNCISIVRRRDLIQNGEAVITTYVKDKKLEDIVKEFVKKNHIFTHSVTQVIKDKEERYHLIECNTRFGGASTLSYKIGLESFYWFFLESTNQQIMFYQKYEKLKQIRIQEDVYIED